MNLNEGAKYNIVQTNRGHTNGPNGLAPSNGSLYGPNGYASQTTTPSNIHSNGGKGVITPSNGRVDLIHTKTTDLFQMYDKIPANQCVTFRNATEGLWIDTDLSNTFFSGKNICLIQNGIRHGVYKLSNQQYTISNQDEDTLKIIMRSMFLQYAANQLTNITEQVEELNKMVLNYAIPQVYNEAQGYNKYLSDASTMYTPMNPPISTQNNDKELVLKPWF